MDNRPVRPENPRPEVVDERDECVKTPLEQERGAHCAQNGVRRILRVRKQEPDSLIVRDVPPCGQVARLDAPYMDQVTISNGGISSRIVVGMIYKTLEARDKLGSLLAQPMRTYLHLHFLRSDPIPEMLAVCLDGSLLWV